MEMSETAVDAVCDTAESGDESTAESATESSAQDKVVDAFDEAAEDASVDGENVAREQDGEAVLPDEKELREINEVCGSDFGTFDELPNHERYLELRESGLLSVREALYAANCGELPRKVNKRSMEGRMGAGADTRGHLSSVRNRESGGEVFTRAERDELALWGITSTGAELERLWQRAGMGSI